MSELALALLFILVVGFGPAYALTRNPLLALAASGTTAGLSSTVAATASLVTGTALLPWALASTAAGWVVGARAIGQRRRTRPQPGPASPGTAAALLTAVLAAPVLAGALAAPAAWDARSIWWFHASWFWQGGGAAADALGNLAFNWSHADYPPLAPATVASAWSVVEGGDLWFAQAVTSVQTWLACLLGALLLTGALRHRRPAATVAAAVAGAAFVVGCFSFGEGLGARGYVDLLWAATATAGAVAALALPPGRRATCIAATCFAAAALTKGDGLVTVVAVLIPLAALRLGLARRRAALPDLGWLALAAVAGLTWPLLVSRYTATGNASISRETVLDLLGGDPDSVGRARPTVETLWDLLQGTALGAAVVIGLGLALMAATRGRPRPPLAPVWLAVAAAGAFAMMAFVFVAGVHDLGWWLMTAGQRTMTVVRCLLLAEVLLWVVIALDRLSAPNPAAGPRAEAGPSAAAAEAPAGSAGPVEADGPSGPPTSVGGGGGRRTQRAGPRDGRGRRATGWA